MFLNHSLIIIHNIYLNIYLVLGISKIGYVREDWITTSSEDCSLVEILVAATSILREEGALVQDLG